MRNAIVLCLCFIATNATFGCGARPTSASANPGETANAENATPSSDWPRVMTVANGSGPALYFGPESEAAAIGYISQDVRVRLEAPPQSARVSVTVSGDLAARGFAPLSRLRATVLQKGRIDGTPVYFGAGDKLELIARNEDGSFRARAHIPLGHPAGGTYAGPFDVTVPRAMVLDEPTEAQTLSEGREGSYGEGQAIELFDRPDGQRIATLTPTAHQRIAATVLRERDGWFGVRVGLGPYLVGYTRENPQGNGLLGSVASAAPEIPARIAQESGALFRVASGTRVRFYDRVIAVLRADGYARSLSEDGENIDVFVACDDRAAVRGLVPRSALTAVANPQ